jgi:hypothetical protein
MTVAVLVEGGGTERHSRELVQVRRHEVLALSGRKARLVTGSRQPVAIEAAAEATKPSRPLRSRSAPSEIAASRGDDISATESDRALPAYGLTGGALPLAFLG